MATPPPDGFYTTDEFFSEPEKFAAFAGALNPRKRHLYKGLMVERGRCSLVLHTPKTKPKPKQQLEEHLIATGEKKPPKPKKAPVKRKFKSHRQRRVLPPLDTFGDDIPLLTLSTLHGLSNPELRKYGKHFNVTFYTGAKKEGLVMKIKEAGAYKKISS